MTTDSNLSAAMALLLASALSPDPTSAVKVRLNRTGATRPEFTPEEIQRLSELSGKEKKEYVKELKAKHVADGGEL